MGTKVKKIVLLGVVCMLGISAAGCSSGLVPGTKAASERAEDAEQTEDSAKETARDTAEMDKPKETQKKSKGKWQVLEPEVAAVVDADFQGKVWKLDEDSFSIVETKVKILEDGSLSSSTPSSNAKIPDSKLIPVVFDGDTYFYIRTIYDDGARYEDTEAGFQDLEEKTSIDLKGRFEDDVFYADEVRIVRFS